MDAISVGNTIAELRKKNGFTQTDLAQKLGISSKTVSKWENGNGYPDIVFFPKLASLFGVSIDQKMQRLYVMPVAATSIPEPSLRQVRLILSLQAT